MSKPTICFDLGGVIVQIRHSWDKILTDLSLTPPNPKPIYGKLIDFPALDDFQSEKITFDQYLKELAQHLGNITKEEAHQVHAHILHSEYPGALNLVQTLQANNFTVGCLSNTNKPHIDECLNSGRFPVCHSFNKLITSYEVKSNKPDPTIYLAFEKALNVKDHNVIFFDDALKNVQAAINIGWQAHQIDPNNNPIQQIKTHLKSHQITF